jgi:hypothetical protein
MSGVIFVGNNPISQCKILELLRVMTFAIRASHQGFNWRGSFDVEIKI